MLAILNHTSSLSLSNGSWEFQCHFRAIGSNLGRGGLRLADAFALGGTIESTWTSNAILLRKLTHCMNLVTANICQGDGNIPGEHAIYSHQFRTMKDDLREMSYIKWYRDSASLPHAASILQLRSEDVLVHVT